MSNETQEKLEKNRFVDRELTAMLKAATHGFVKCCQYVSIDGDYDEHVYVHMGESSCMEVNVSCDSLWAIAKDVMSAVARLY